MFKGEVDPERILLKAKWKNAFSFMPVPYDEEGSIKLADLVKHDDKVNCEESKIEVNLLHKKLRLLVNLKIFSLEDIFLDTLLFNNNE